MKMLILLSTLFSYAQDSTKPTNYYTDTLNLNSAPKRVNNILPLSHQKDKSWLFQKDFSDEFNAEKLDTNKWYGTHPKWLGRKPSMAHPDNVSLEKGELVLAINQAKDITFKEGYTHSLS